MLSISDMCGVYCTVQNLQNPNRYLKIPKTGSHVIRAHGCLTCMPSAADKMSQARRDEGQTSSHQSEVDLEYIVI